MAENDVDEDGRIRWAEEHDEVEEFPLPVLSGDDDEQDEELEDED